MKQLTIVDLRDIIFSSLAKTISIHRSSKRAQGIETPNEFEEVTEEEVDEFITHNELFDFELIEQLSDPGLLGFESRIVRVNDEWLREFKENVQNWAHSNAWLGADSSLVEWVYTQRVPIESELWIPKNEKPLWVHSSPTCLILANQLLKEGRLLSEMGWRQFEELIGILLEKEGWKVEVTRQSRDGGIDVIAYKKDETIGEIKSVWQAKKYGPSNYVKLSEVRELSAVREDSRATKGIIVTTSRLSKDAIDWIKRDLYRLDYKDHEKLKKWIMNTEF
ncbi:hypothetical protein ACH33_15745 [Aneurinibacillus sp. XH2]|uniref:restriction endonuclease n=1 Tax=Aneurinibacillus sp. XH2 TaxID=1450761 RepID=UPI00070A03DB|nr:restriction endonuclease [Aneurinibacillus sp. XH2]AMA74126.1 hypothetical protein ACH33_15745 [Aneurinibacillus sp. XH2]